jgi:prefoldin alpha subunit
LAEGVSKVPSEEEIQQLLQAYQRYQSEAEAIVRQEELFKISIDGCNKALKAIESMKTAEVGQNILVSIGEGSFIHAKLASTDKVILDVGANVSIEKNVDDAKETLSKRKDQLEEGVRKLNETLGQINQEMGKVQSLISQYEQVLARGGKVVQ